MHFLVEHPFLILFAVVFGFLAYYSLFRLSASGGIMESFESAAPKIGRGLFVWVGIGIPVAYLATPALYPYMNTGAIGDMFIFLNIAVKSAFAFHARHMSFPLVLQGMLKAAGLAGIMDANSSRYLETVAMIASWPARVMVLGAIFFWLKTASGRGFSKISLALQTLFLGFSYFAWAWGIQPNAIGIMIGFQITTAAAWLRWTRSGSPRWLTLFAVALCLSIYAHISSLFFAFGSGLAALVWILKRSPSHRRGTELGVLAAVCGVFGFAFYGVTLEEMARVAPTLNPTVGNALYFLSDPETVGYPDWNPAHWLIPAKTNVVTSVQNIFNYWAPRGAWDSFWIFLELSGLVGLALASFRRKSIDRDLFYFGTFVTVSCFIGFLPRAAGTHYYGTAGLANFCLLASLFFVPETTSPALDGISLRRRVAMVELVCAMIMIVGMIGYSGFSSWRVTQAKSLDDLEVLSGAKRLQAQFGPDRKISVLTLHYDPYLFTMGEEYFKSQYPGIHWVSLKPEEASESQVLAVARKLRETTTVVLGETFRGNPLWISSEFQSMGSDDFRVMR